MRQTKKEQYVTVWDVTSFSYVLLTNGFAVIRGSCLTMATSSQVKGMLLTGKPLSSYLKTFSQTCYSLLESLNLDLFREQTSISDRMSSV